MIYIVNIQNAPTSTMVYEDLQQAELYYRAAVVGQEISGDTETNITLRSKEGENPPTLLKSRFTTKIEQHDYSPSGPFKTFF